MRPHGQQPLKELAEHRAPPHRPRVLGVGGIDGLPQEELQTTIPWVDFVVHKLLPVVIVIALAWLGNRRVARSTRPAPRVAV